MAEMLEQSALARGADLGARRRWGEGHQPSRIRVSPGGRYVGEGERRRVGRGLPNRKPPLQDEGVGARTVYVDTMHVAATDFSITRDVQQGLFDNGRSAATSFLTAWTAVADAMPADSADGAAGAVASGLVGASIAVMALGSTPTHAARPS
jgi:hypothetical protein